MPVPVSMYIHSNACQKNIIVSSAENVTKGKRIIKNMKLRASS